MAVHTEQFFGEWSEVIVGTFFSNLIVYGAMFFMARLLFWVASKDIYQIWPENHIAALPLSVVAAVGLSLWIPARDSELNVIEPGLLLVISVISVLLSVYWMSPASKEDPE
ncbi:MAG: hypothetical protein HLX50_02925 [Alteromonadaceae bacterium]|nr:hypothetical protein [Alteromonadaceae bacterium]